MKKFNVHVVWNHGFEHDYQVVGGMPGTKYDAVQSAKDHLESITHLKSYKISDEDGNVIFEKTNQTTDLGKVEFH